MMSRIILKIWNLLRKTIGWALFLLAAMFFVASILPLVVGNYGVFITGLIMSFLILVLSLEIQTDREKIKKRIVGLMSYYFPSCPICKSDIGYESRGWLSSSQYVRCKNCGGQWTSNDFIGYKDLRALKLWEPPEDSSVYAKFISESALKPRKTYSVKLWRALMNDEEIQSPIKERRMKIVTLISFHQRGIGYFTISLVVSIIPALIGYHCFSLTTAEAYILFVSSFLFISFGLIVKPK